jgi:hypothetical protein
MRSGRTQVRQETLIPAADLTQKIGQPGQVFEALFLVYCAGQFPESIFFGSNLPTLFTHAPERVAEDLAHQDCGVRPYE